MRILIGTETPYTRSIGHKAHVRISGSPDQGQPGRSLDPPKTFQGIYNVLVLFRALINLRSNEPSFHHTPEPSNKTQWRGRSCVFFKTPLLYVFRVWYFEERTALTSLLCLIARSRSGEEQPIVEVQKNYCSSMYQGSKEVLPRWPYPLRVPLRVTRYQGNSALVPNPD